MHGDAPILLGLFEGKLRALEIWDHVRWIHNKTIKNFRKFGPGSPPGGYRPLILTKTPYRDSSYFKLKVKVIDDIMPTNNHVVIEEDGRNLKIP